MEQENLTRESSDSQPWSEENQIYYYSKFQLFEHADSQTEFYQYSIFIERINSELGHQWRQQANAIYQPYFSSRDVFMNLLEIWLHSHPTVNSVQHANTHKITFSQHFLDQFIQKMDYDLKAKHPNQIVHPPFISLKAICMGFFMTSNQIWEQMFQTEKIPQKRQLFSTNFLIKGVTKTLQKTFKPLMVITQKINSVLGKKKRKVNEELVEETIDQSKFQNCYHEFRKTLDIQKHLERKMSEFNLNEEDDQFHQTNKIIEKKQFKEAESPVQPNMISSVYSYVTEFLNRNHSWQVASNFVTQILDLNHMQIEEGKRVKVLRPAEDFYEKLVIVWLLFQNNEKTQPLITFQMYLSRLKSTYFSESWKEKYMMPTKYFYEKMNHDWSQIQAEIKDSKHVNQKQVLQIFISRIRNSMKEDWDKKIHMNKHPLSKTS